MIPFHDGSFLIVGLARDCEKQIAGSVAILSQSFSLTKSLRFLVVESDSSDKTIDSLCSLARENNAFNYVSLGRLLERYPKRTERIAFCRNHYLKLIDACTEYQDVDYVVVADLDGLNSKLSSDSIASCWSRTDWDVCTANQDGPYYDIWALRHPLWSPNDCWRQAKFLTSCGVGRFKSIFSAVYSRMIMIHSDAEWIEVESAFGGLAIYRKIALDNVGYIGLSKNGEELCEHVPLHMQIRENGGRIFVNPRMLNASFVEHARNAKSFGLVCFWFRCQLWGLADYLRILPYLKKARTLPRVFFKCLRKTLLEALVFPPGCRWPAAQRRGVAVHRGAEARLTPIAPATSTWGGRHG